MTAALRDVLHQRALRELPPQVNVDAIVRQGRRVRRVRRTMAGFGVVVVCAGVGAGFAWFPGDPPGGSRGAHVAAGRHGATVWADRDSLHLGTLSVPRPDDLWTLVEAGGAAVYSTWDGRGGATGEVVLLRPDGSRTTIGGVAPGVMASGGDYAAWFEPADRVGGEAYTLRVYDVRAGEFAAERQVTVTDPGFDVLAPPVLAVDGQTVVYGGGGQAWEWVWAAGTDPRPIAAREGRVVDVAGGVVATFDGPPPPNSGIGTGRLINADLGEVARVENVEGLLLDPQGRFAFAYSEERGGLLVPADGAAVRPLQWAGVAIVAVAWDPTGRLTVAGIESDGGEQGTYTEDAVARLGSCDPVTGECALVEQNIGPAGGVKLADGDLG